MTTSLVAASGHWTDDEALECVSILPETAARTARAGIAALPTAEARRTC